MNTNGVISFEIPFTDPSTDPFPLPASRDDSLIAPFWADVNTQNGGDVWYHQSTNSTLLNRASIEIRNAFPPQASAGFTATNLFIATWDRVAPFSSSGNDRVSK